MSRAKPAAKAGAKPAIRAKGAAAAPAASAEESLLMAGLTAFHAQHQSVYRSRWLRSLYPALLLPHPSVAVINAHLPPRAIEGVRRMLRARGAVPWHRGRQEQGEIEVWRFEDAPQSDAAAAAPAAASELSELESGLAGASLEDEGAMAAAMASASEGEAGRFLPPAPLDATSPLLPYYLLDGASVLAVEALQVKPHHVVLDLCAAPGGKSVCIAQHLDLLGLQTPATATGASTPLLAPAPGTLATAIPHSQLHANEPQGTRRVRLQSVLDEYIPPTVRRNRARVEVTPFDATRVALPHARYDRVLVDAPCSSDRHVLQSAKELAGWSAKRIKQNAERQVLLLLNALRATKVGGVCVYATCSLSRRENDEVIDAVLAKLARNNRNGAGGAQQQVRVKVLPIRLGNGPNATGSAASAAAAAGSNDSEEDVLYLPMGEATNRGWMVLPDQASFVPAPTTAAASAGAVDAAAPPAKAVGHGFGPLYFARLKRISAKEAGSDSDDSDEEDSSEESEGEIEPRRRPDRQLPLEEDEEQDE